MLTSHNCTIYTLFTPNNSSMFSNFSVLYRCEIPSPALVIYNVAEIW